MTRPFITVDGITVRLRDHWLLGGLSWRIQAGEHWVIAGPNGAGKTTLAKAIAGILPVVQGKIHYHAFADLMPTRAIAYIASDFRREIWRREHDLAHGRDFAGRYDDITPVSALLAGPAGVVDQTTVAANDRFRDVVKHCGIEGLLNESILSISTGEMARVLVARELLGQPRMLVLDEPFEGLDEPGRRSLLALLDGLAGSGLSLLLITHRLGELPVAMTHCLALEGGRIVSQGPLDRVAPFTPVASLRVAPDPLSPPPEAVSPLSRLPDPMDPAPTLIDMRAVTVKYGSKRVLDRLTWSVQAGQHWAVTGPNGAGKSTLLKLITGDCLQVHANTIRLFGRDRGPSQTLGAVRRHLGLVSHDLSARYQKRLSALEVIFSGFFDSVGLYRQPEEAQLKRARGWLERMELLSLAQIPFNQLSQGQRQMVLIARAMVKSPALMILDEPLAGLDGHNRVRVRALLENIGKKGRTTLIVVSHHPRDIPTCTTHQLALDRGQVIYNGPIDGYRADQSSNFSAALRPSS